MLLHYNIVKLAWEDKKPNIASLLAIILPLGPIQAPRLHIKWGATSWREGPHFPPKILKKGIMFQIQLAATGGGIKSPNPDG